MLYLYGGVNPSIEIFSINSVLQLVPYFNPNPLIQYFTFIYKNISKNTELPLCYLKCRKPSINHQHGHNIISFHKGLVTLDVLFPFQLISGSNMTTYGTLKFLHHLKGNKS